MAPKLTICPTITRDNREHVKRITKSLKRPAIKKITPEDTIESKCADCEAYKRTNGRGCDDCLTCSHYINWKKMVTRRPEFAYSILTAQEFESEPDGNPTTALQAIQMLPDDLSAIMSMHYYAGLSVKSIAGILHTSTKTVSRKLSLGMSYAKKNVNQLKRELAK